MYLHKNHLIINEITDIKEYKRALKEKTKLNLRRSSKFNVLAILGAMNCIKSEELSQNSGIYVCSEYSSILSVKKVLHEMQNSSMIMPFDFLNINSNNVSFYVSQALNAKGKNMLLTSDELSFEKGLELALFELEINEVSDAVIGLVDESLIGIPNYSKYISNEKSRYDKDYSGWLYLNQQKENSLCKIELIGNFDSKDQLNKMIENEDYDMLNENSMISFVESVSDFISSKNKKMIYIAMDKENKGLVFLVSK